jgi:N-acetylmuramoyl-L-alanine amidase
LADNENRADVVAGFAGPTHQQDPVISILVDLLRREMRRQSYNAARSIVTQLEPSVRMRRFPVRKADFLVLQAPDVPSILLELGFLSNAEDIANLTTNVWQDRVAQGVAKGIAAYFDSFSPN